MTPAIVNILLAAQAACAAHVTHYAYGPTGWAPSAWDRGFEQCVYVAPEVDRRLESYFSEQRRRNAAKQLRNQHEAIRKAAAVLVESP